MRKKEVNVRQRGLRWHVGIYNCESGQHCAAGGGVWTVQPRGRRGEKARWNGCGGVWQMPWFFTRCPKSACGSWRPHQCCRRCNHCSANGAAIKVTRNGAYAADGQQPVENALMNATKSSPSMMPSGSNPSGPPPATSATESTATSAVAKLLMKATKSEPSTMPSGSSPSSPVPATSATEHAQPMVSVAALETLLPQPSATMQSYGPRSVNRWTGTVRVAVAAMELIPGLIGAP